MAGIDQHTRRSDTTKELKVGDPLRHPHICEGPGQAHEDHCTRLVTRFSGTPGLCSFCHVGHQPSTRRALRGHWKPERGSYITWKAKSTSLQGGETIMVGVVVYCGAAFQDIRHTHQALHWWLNEEERDELTKALEERPNTVMQHESTDGIIVRVPRTGKNGRVIHPHYYCPALYFCDPVEPGSPETLDAPVEEQGDPDEQ